MKLAGLGAEPKKLAWLGGLLAVAGGAYFVSSGGGGEAPAPKTAAHGKALPGADPAPAPADGVPAVTSSRREGSGHGLQEFRPSLKRKKGDPLPAAIDPTLRLDLLTKLQKVSLEAGARSLFDFGAEPVKKEPPKIAFNRPFGPMPAAGQPGGPKIEVPPPPPPPAIPLKFYGFVSAAARVSGSKRAFFLDGEDIVVAGEGDLVKKRYRIVRIGISSADVEDTEHKNQQTLPLVQEQEG